VPESKQTAVTIDGRELKVSNLDKVLYPESGFTKGEVIDYYARIAPVLLTHLGDRGITMRRFPNGVDAGSFFEKRCPKHRPEWVQVAPGPGDHGGAIDYCRLADEASVVWAANMAALELHAPMARCDDIETPTMVVFDLDPGAPAGMEDCAEVGLWIRDVLDGLGLQCFAKTSGSKGLQVYVPENHPPLTTAMRPIPLADFFGVKTSIVKAMPNFRPYITSLVRLYPGISARVELNPCRNSKHAASHTIFDFRMPGSPAN